MVKGLVIIIAVATAAAFGFPLLEKFEFARLPGDIAVERPDFQFYLPLATSIVLSALLTVAFWLLNR